MTTFDIKQVKLIVGGQLITGFQNGSSIEVARDEDVFSATSGLDGGFIRSKKYDNLATATFTLMMNSPANDVLNNLANQDKITGNGIAPFFITDLNAIGVKATGLCWVMKIPSINYSNESSGREWGLHIGNYNENITGGISFLGAIGL